MGITFRLDHLIIKISIILLLLFGAGTILCCEHCKHMKKMTPDFLDFNIEQKYWNDWISINDDNTCPLQPFILSYTLSDFKIFEKEIIKLGDTHSYILFIQINIDNGIFYISYLAWNDAGQITGSLEWHGPESKIIRNRLNKKQINMHLVEELNNHDVFVDIGDRKLLDGDSLYLTLRHEDKYNRFAFYNPKINEDNIPYLLVKELLSMKKESKD
jgi:hypothetical protein